VEPTIKQSESDINIKNDQLTRPDNPATRGKPIRSVQESELTEEDILAGLVAKGVGHLLKRAFGTLKPVKAAKTTTPKIKAAPAPKPPKPPTQAQRKQADKDKSQADFDGWKHKKIAMSNVFKAAHAAGIGNDINPMRVRLDKQARAKNPLKQPNEPPKETPAAPTTKPRIRIQAGSRIKENEAAPTNISSGIALFSPLLGTTTKKRRKKRK
jgi:hypothetical protein